MTGWEAAILVPIAATLGYAGVAVMRFWAMRRNLLDVPNHRSSHSRPTPRGGGLPVAVLTILGWLALEIVRPSGTPWAALLAYGAGAGTVALIGWVDDVHSLSARTRLVVHAFAAAIAVAVLGYWESVVVLPGRELTLGRFGLGLTLLWIVGLTNAYNFMDGSDGIAGVQAVVAAVGWACVGWLSDSPGTARLALLLAAGSLGFLGHNWPPARVFLGDVGSGFLGYSFAIMPLLALRHDRLATISPLLGLLFVWPFVFDTAWTFFRRLRKGENVFVAHRSHLYQRLIIAGYSHRFVMVLYGASAAVGAAAGVCCTLSPAAAWGCAVVLPAVAALLLGFTTITENRAARGRTLLRGLGSRSPTAPVIQPGNVAAVLHMAERTREIEHLKTR